MDIITSIEDSGIGIWVRESSSLFAYTGILFCHALGLALVVGLSWAVDMRILGIGKRIALAPLERFFPVIWVGFWLNAFSGVLLLIAGATKMLTMPLFYFKMAFIIMGVVNVKFLRQRTFHSTPSSSADEVPDGARRLAITSMVLWSAALIAGRLTAYPKLVASLFE